jgi:Flp pilus assembly protein TadD
MKRTQNVKYYVAASIGLATFIIYLTALRNGFVNWDDDLFVLDNYHIRSFNAAFFKWSFLDFYEANWHPLTWISHAVDYAIWGLNPLGHHLTSILLHAANTFLVAFLVMRLLEAFKERTLESKQPSFLTERLTLTAAGVTGLLFGLHPLHVESVAWVAERKDVLCALFFLLSVLTYTNYARSMADGEARKTAASPFMNRAYLLTAGFFILALLSKPMAVTLPLVLLILDWHPFGRVRSLKTFWPAFVEKLPFFALSLASSILTVLAQRAEGSLSSIEIIPLSIRVLVGSQALIAYLGKMIVPLNLSPYYPYPRDVSFLSSEYLLTIALVIGLTAVCFVTVKKQKVWLAAWGYYVVTLLPVLGIVQVGSQSMADRYTYLPSLGPFLIGGLAAAWIFEKVNTVRRYGQVIKIISAGAVSLILVAVPYLTYKQIKIWDNGVRLWDYAIATEPESAAFAYYNRAVIFYKMGQLDKAIKDFDRSIYLDPSFWEAYNSKGVALEKSGRLDSAIADFDKAIALDSLNYKAYNNRGLAFAGLGEVGKAIADYNMAITLKPSNNYEPYFNLGVLYGRVGSVVKAIEFFNQSINMNLMHLESYKNRGLCYFYIGQNGKALEDFNRAIELKQDFAEVYFDRGNLYLNTGNRGLALADFQKACNLGNKDGCKALQ